MLKLSSALKATACTLGFHDWGMDKDPAYTAKEKTSGVNVGEQWTTRMCACCETSQKVHRAPRSDGTFTPWRPMDKRNTIRFADHARAMNFRRSVAVRYGA